MGRGTQFPRPRDGRTLDELGQNEELGFLGNLPRRPGTTRRVGSVPFDDSFDFAGLCDGAAGIGHVRDPDANQDD